jgi:hypothetical protein
VACSGASKHVHFFKIALILSNINQIALNTHYT